MSATVLYFADEQAAALRFAQAAGLSAQQVQSHRFPDGELKLTLPTPLPAEVVVYRSLVNPNEKWWSCCLWPKPPKYWVRKP